MPKYAFYEVADSLMYIESGESSCMNQAIDSFIACRKMSFRFSEGEKIFVCLDENYPTINYATFRVIPPTDIKWELLR